MNVRVRLAPSPTGNLHIGTARTAVFNWLFARNQGGKFILRVEDTDVERSKSEYTDNIIEGLTWLGMNWDEGPSFQSQRLEIYRQAVQTLLDKGLAYRCYTSSEELDKLREAQKANKQAPRYDNRHRNLTPEQREAFEAEGRQAVIRFMIEDDRTISWNDMVRDTVTWKGSDLGGDMVIARASSGGAIGQPLYNLAVVVDDIDMAITHVIRGEDHIGNTPKQILLYEALGATLPVFAHTPLILNLQGQKLSKRDGVTSISDFKDMGYIPEALVNYMTLLGWTAPDSTQEIFTLSEAAAVFTFDRVNKAGAKFDWDKLNWLNGQYLHKMPVSQLTDLLVPYWQKAGYEFDSKADRPWLEQIAALIGPSLVRLTDAVGMCKLFFSPTVEYEEEAIAQLQQTGAASALQAVLEALESHSTLTSAEAQKITKKLSKEKNLNKGLIMRSLRAGLTGAMHGPDLIESWVILHQRGTAKTRLLDAISNLNLSAVGVAAQTPTPEPPNAETSAAIPAETSAPEQPAVEVTAVETPTVETVATPVTEPAAEVTAVETPTVEIAAEVTAVETPTVETVGTEVSAVDISTVETAAAAVEIPAANQQKTIASGEMTSSNEPETTVIITEIPAENEADSTKVIITEEPPNQTQQIKEQIISILSELPAYIGSFYEQYKSPLTVVGVILASIVSLKVLLGVIDELNDIPLLAPTFELIGIGYSAWFIYRYLLRSSNRQQLGQEIQALKEQVFGKKS
nr:glutamate--tRNA ligase [Microcoleus sp. bin38.metabat.b11b12b14.051]